MSTSCWRPAKFICGNARKICTDIRILTDHLCMIPGIIEIPRAAIAIVSEGVRRMFLNSVYGERVSIEHHCQEVTP